VGEIILHRDKDRLGFLPPTVTLSIGGGEQGFVCQRSAGTVPHSDSSGLTQKQQKAIMVLRTDFAESGVGFNEWRRKVDCSSATLSTAIKVLTRMGQAEQRGDLYFPTEQTDEEVRHG
jgi:hypothetical protein